VVAAAQEADRRAVLVVDANTGRVLYERSADALRHPASLTKLMTLLILFEHIEQGRLGLASKIRFSANAVSAPPSRLEVEEGAEIDVIDAIKVLIVKSANDVAVAVAERIAGSEEHFAELMNRKAREIGMKDTVFRNASGLPDPDQVTTARDMIVLALRLQDQFPKYYPLFSLRELAWAGETFRNHNTLLFRYRGLDGMKTGYTRASGFNLVASARRGRKHVLAAYFGGTTAALRNAAVRAHLDAAFAKAADVVTRRPTGPILAHAPAKAAAAAPGKSAAAATAKAPSLATGAAPVTQPVAQPVLRAAAAPEVEVVRVRPVLAAPLPTAGPASDASKTTGDLRTPAPPAKAPVLAKAAPAPEAADEDAGAATAPRPTVVAAAGAGPFQIQVGAYQTQGEAERQLATVRERAGAVLGAYPAHMTQVKLGPKTFFRARYVGFDAHATAAGVCTELKRLEIDCVVMKAE
jgi:D-alanyl-D-alanine carboxypeptidase